MRAPTVEIHRAAGGGRRGACAGKRRSLPLQRRHGRGEPATQGKQRASRAALAQGRAARSRQAHGQRGVGARATCMAAFRARVPLAFIRALYGTRSRHAAHLCSMSYRRCLFSLSSRTQPFSADSSPPPAPPAPLRAGGGGWRGAGGRMTLTSHGCLSFCISFSIINCFFRISFSARKVVNTL